ncbi:PQQ-dependent sugar dehydrogenase [Algibacter aquimarinus]|uniref:T9SS type A sorting domain-containing protein n=1 Tax=Algibacter aquimarinus TaxID=1136748 RepID=A0ABP9HAK2_9FLAO
MNSKKINILYLFLLLCLTINAQITYESAFPNIDFEFPVEIQSPNDGTDRIFVVEQEGRIKVFPRNSSVTSGDVSTFLDITNRVSFGNGQEIGLLGLAFHPDFTNNGFVYVYYTAPTTAPGGIDIKMVLSRFTVNNGNINLADSNSELIIFDFDKNIDWSNHNGGKIAFGTDGYLYISIGDGGGGSDPFGNGQNTNTIFGNILRIDVDIDGSNPTETNPALPNGNYEIPSDNPFVSFSGLDEIYAYGIRNTWKFSIDYVTNIIWGADVGQGTFEEINIIENGNNYGWSTHEGFDNNDTSTTDPVFIYDRSADDKSITGGYVYRGSEITSLNPNINSKYIFGDYISGRVWALDYNPTTKTASSTLLFKTNGENISSFGVDKNGELYFSDYGSNAKLYKLVDGTTLPSGNTVNGIGQWSNLDEGIINGSVEAIVTAPNGNVYHGGNFSNAGNISANNIAVWNNTNGWQALGNGSNGTIRALKLASNGNLYAAGSFSEIDGISANNIAEWDGSSWSTLGSGVDGPVAALEIDSSGNLYVAGVFEQVNGTTVRNIALWNGTFWSALTDATNAQSGTNNEIRSLAIDNNDILYAGGNFDEAGGNTANRIATWDGTNWGTLGSGTSGFVEAIATTDTDVYIGGNFGLAGGITVNRIARWSKTNNNWSTLGNGTNNIVNSLIHDGTNLYAGGSFNNCNIDSNNSIIVNNIAQWSESNGWQALGTNTSVGVDIKVNALSFASDSDGINRVFAGGNFNNAGLVSVNNTAQWTSNFLNVNKYKDETSIYIYPNPTTGIINLDSEYKWTLFNTLGKIMKTGESKILSVDTYPAGLYFLKTEKGSTIKIIKK